MSKMNEKNERKLSSRIVILVLIASVFLIVQSVYNINNNKSVERSLEQVESINKDLSKHVNTVATMVRHIRMLSMQLVLAPNKKLKNEIQEKIYFVIDEMEVYLNTHISKSNNKAFQKIAQKWFAYKEVLETTIYYMENNIRVAAFISVYQQEETKFLALESSLNLYIEGQRQVGQEVYLSAKNNSSEAFYTLIITAVIQVLIFLSILYTVYKMFQNYIRVSKEHEKELDRQVKEKTYELEKLLGSFDTNVIASKSDLQGRITYVSKAFEKISGYSKEELIGQPHSLVRHPDTPKEVFEELWSTIQAAMIWQGEVKNKRKDGSFYWVKIVISPEYDENARQVGYSAIREDITAHKEVEELSKTLEQKVEERTLELNENATFMNTLIDNLPTAVFAKDVKDDFRFITWNKKSEELFGLKADEVTGKNDFDFYTQEKAEYFLKTDKEVITKQEVTVIPEERISTTDGERILSTLKIGIADEMGNPKTLLGIAIDITEQKQNQEELKNQKEFVQTLLDSQEQLIITTDGMEVLTANATFNEFFVVDNVEEFREAYNAVCICDTFNTNAPEGYLQTQMGRESWIDYVISRPYNTTHKAMITMGETDYIFSVSAVKLPGDGELKSAVFTNITEMELAQREIEEQQQKFSSMVSNVPGAIYRVIDDSAWPIIYMSDEIENITGYPASDFMESKIVTFSTIMYPDDVEPMGKIIADQFAQGKKFQIDYRVIRKDGNITWVRSQGQSVKSENGEAFIDGVLIDITKAKEAEEQIELLTQLVHGSLESASVGAWWIDFTEEDIFHALQTTADMVGLEFIQENSDKLVISEWKETLEKTAEISAEYKEAIYEAFENFSGAITGKSESYHAIYPIVYNNGDVRWIEARADVTRRDEKGNALLMTGTLIDITEMREAKTQIEKIHKHTRESIEYASLIQGALIPDNRAFRKYFSDYFAIWHPKDTIGGDIYLFEELRDSDECLLMVIDCTGHGVPGAFVTMLVKAIERQIIGKINNDHNIDVSPAWILSYFNRKMKSLLNQNDKDSISNAGFDGGVIYFNKKQNFLKFAGAETPLFYREDEELKTIKGNRHSIGYKNSDKDYEFTDHSIEIKEGMSFYLTTDGYLDQNGGEKSFPFGKKRFKKIIEQYHQESMADQQEVFLNELDSYQGEEETNDDVTLVGFRV